MSSPEEKRPFLVFLAFLAFLAFLVFLVFLVFLHLLSPLTNRTIDRFRRQNASALPEVSAPSFHKYLPLTAPETGFESYAPLGYPSFSNGYPSSPSLLKVESDSIFAIAPPKPMNSMFSRSNRQIPCLRPPKPIRQHLASKFCYRHALKSSFQKFGSAIPRTKSRTHRATPGTNNPTNTKTPNIL